MIFLTIFLLFIFYWVIDAFILQLSAKLLIKNKPDFANAFGLIGLSYGVFFIIIILSMFFSLAFLGRIDMLNVLSRINEMDSIIVSLLNFFPSIFLFYIVIVIVYVFVMGWIYGKFLKDEQDMFVGFGRGVLLFLVNVIISRSIFLIVLNIYFWIVGTSIFMFI